MTEISFKQYPILTRYIHNYYCNVRLDNLDIIINSVGCTDKTCGKCLNLL